MLNNTILAPLGDALDAAIEPGLIRQGKPVAAVREGLSTAMGASRRAVERVRADAKSELSDLLTRQGQGANILDVVERARAGNLTGPATGAPIGVIGNMLGFSALPRAAEGLNNGLIQSILGR